MPLVSEMSPAVTTPGPLARDLDSRFGPSTSIFTATPLRFSTMSVTSSRTPGDRGELVQHVVDLDAR